MATILHKRKLKEIAFAKEYVKQGMNGKKALLAVVKTKIKPTSATVEASRLLRKVNVQEMIMEELRKGDFEIQGVLKIHKMNMEQSQDLNVSQRAVSDYYKLLGLQGKTTNNMVMFDLVEE